MATPRAVNCIYPMWQDGEGGQAATGYTLLDQSAMSLGAYGTLMSTAMTLSLAKQAFVTLQYKAAGGGSTGTGVYQGILDRVEFAVKSENYVKLLAIPAPKESIFVPGSDIVDMSNSDVESFVAQVMSVLGDSYGSPWTSIAPGKRRRIGGS